MELIKTIKMKKYHILCVVAISLVAAFIFSSLMGNNAVNIVKLYNAYRMYGGGVRTYNCSEITAVNYNIDGQNYVSLNNDPQLIINGVNEYVGSIDIFFEMPVTQDIPIEIFWGVEGEGFVPERIHTAVARKGEQNVNIFLQEKVTDLRLDIGTSQNISFALSSISINKEIPKTLMNMLVQCIKVNVGDKSWFDRVQILFLIFIFILIHFVIDVKKMYQVLFDKRWIVAGIILIFMVVNKYHGDSIACFDSYVQPGDGSDYVLPVIGEERSIRSDEWLTATPIDFSTQYLEHPYAQYNNLVRATDTVNDNGLTIMSALNPVSLIRMLIRFTLGFDYAYSFGWYAGIFLAFLFQLELFLIISSRQKLLSVCGTCMIILSSHYLWWGFPGYILYSSVALVCAYYFFQSETMTKKIIYAYGTAVGTAQFVMMLYPAWEVPVGFYALAVFIWIIHEHWNNIKRMSKADWGIFVSALLLCIIMIVSNMLLRRDYMESISSTVYPGARIEYGGFSLTKLFNYVGAALFAYVDYGNPSESGMYITLFPLPLIIALYVWFKGNRKNWLLNGLIIISIFLGLYTTVGLPHFLARITFMTYSTPNRCVDILGYVQVVLFVIALSNLDLDHRINKKYAFIFAMVLSTITIIIASDKMPGYMSGEYKIIFLGVLLFVFFSCIAKVNERIYNWGLIMIILIAVVTGIYVRPICKGLDAIYSKSVAKEIEKIVQEDNQAKWIACDTHVTPQFVLACGAPVINSVNIYPNMELWSKLDPTGVNNFVYNRFAHIIISFTDNETDMKVIQDDLIRLNLGFKDLQKTDVEYVLSLRPLAVDNQYVRFNEVFDECGAYIYKVQYH